MTKGSASGGAVSPLRRSAASLGGTRGTRAGGPARPRGQRPSPGAAERFCLPPTALPRSLVPGAVIHPPRPAHDSSGGTHWPPLPPGAAGPARSPLTHLNRLGQNGAAAGDGGAPGGHQRHGRDPARLAPARTPRASHGHHHEPPGCRCHRPACRQPRPSPGVTWDLASLAGRRRDRRCACGGRPRPRGPGRVPGARRGREGGPGAPPGKGRTGPGGNRQALQTRPGDSRLHWQRTGYKSNRFIRLQGIKYKLNNVNNEMRNTSSACKTNSKQCNGTYNTSSACNTKAHAKPPPKKRTTSYLKQKHLSRQELLVVFAR